MPAHTGEPKDLSHNQATHNESQAVMYFQAAMDNEDCAVLLADLNTLDRMLNALGIRDTDDDPVMEIERLKSDS